MRSLATMFLERQPGRGEIRVKERERENRRG